jgi:Flp pilus assembly CpaF family ATPase
MNICQRIVSQVGRRVDESSPICDARLPDGSRVNVIAPPLALDGPTLTIRKFKRDKLTMRNLVEYASISPEGARVLGVIGAARCNVLISGGTGSGKTTLLNTLTAFIDPTERVVTCEDAAELQLSSRTWCAWRRARPTSRARARSPCAIWSRTAFGCVRSGSSSAKSAALKLSTCCRP